MNDFKVPVEVDPTEDTEWNDILRSHGIIPERPPSPSQMLEEALQEAVQKQHENRLESKDLDELDELEDEEDEDFLNSYKQQRIEQLQELSAKKKFGSIVPINKQEYESEITQASADCFVLLHMTLTSQLQSRLLSNILQTVAFKFPEIKVCEIPGNRCVENYPDTNCPTLIIYSKTNVVKQYITLTQLGGNDCKIGDIENVLVDVEAVDINDKRLTINQEDEDLEEVRKLRFVKKSIRENDSEDDDFYD
jgi:hypothetical protein